MTFRTNSMIAATLDLIPLRALNQVGYCERLYFLQYVDAVMPTNEFVEDGLFEHRRVSGDELANVTRKDGDALQTRSVSLSSEKWGLTGKLDLVEEKDGRVYPVEYKRSTAPRDENGNPTFWENDALQLCGQALLLEEEMAIEIETGIIYYIGSRERVEVPIDDRLRAKTFMAMNKIHQIAESETPPEPLPAEMRHRCHGCSLVTICQPEETLYQLGLAALPADEGEGEKLAAGLTRVIPQNDDGAVLYLQEPGSHVGKRSEHLVIKKDGKETNRIPMAQVRQVVVFGNVQVSTQALETLVHNEIPVVYLTGYGRFIAAVQPAPAKNVGLREAQYRLFDKPDECLKLSKAVVRAKLMNQRALLMRSLRSKAEGENEPSRGSEEPAARDLAELLHRLDAVTSIESLLGIEGQGAALYFGEFNRFLKSEPGRGFDFQHRNRRPPRDPVNALLSFAYALLAKDCFSALCTVGFDPYRGFFHAGRHGRPSLALDLMEEFRSVIADSVVLNLINNRVVGPDDFLTWGNACQLTEAGRKKFFQTYEQRKSTLVAHPVYGYRMSYSRMLEVQARVLAGYVRGELPSYSGFIVR
jgi:CRISPR-associated protein Cas1